ncbi:hypothetical protein B0H11DRAFT_1928102 [Mycena galericulata]|nr:hypothetical protein B0H11DRAFT_1928102 [Mycena galericulata]
MFSLSTYISLTLIAASVPAYSAPIALSNRGLASVIEGLIGGGAGDIENIIGNFLAASGSPAQTTAAVQSTGVSAREDAAGIIGDIENGVVDGIGSIIDTIFEKCSVIDLPFLHSRRSFSDLTDEQVNTFLEWVDQQGSEKSDKRELEARSILTDILEKAAGALSSGAISGLEKLLGGSSTAAAPTTATSAAAS